MTEWTPEAKARYHDEMQRLRGGDCEAQLELSRNLYDELFSQTEQLRQERDAWGKAWREETAELKEQRQQAQEERDDALKAAHALSCDVTQFAEQRQQAIDALREIAGDGDSNHTCGRYVELAVAALVKLGEQP